MDLIALREATSHIGALNPEGQYVCREFAYFGKMAGLNDLSNKDWDRLYKFLEFLITSRLEGPTAVPARNGYYTFAMHVQHEKDPVKFHRLYKDIYEYGGIKDNIHETMRAMVKYPGKSGVHAAQRKAIKRVFGDIPAAIEAFTDL